MPGTLWPGEVCGRRGEIALVSHDSGWPSKDKSTVCVVPDGVLWDLPFQAVQAKDDRYLLEDFAIYYAPSLGVLKEMFAQRKLDNRLPPSLLVLVIHASQTRLRQI